MITQIIAIIGHVVFPITFAVVTLKLYIKLTTGICHSQKCLKGKTAIVTGANTGIGYETAADFAKRGARVILACRDETKAKEAVLKIQKESHNKDVTFKLLDLASFSSVRKFVEDVKSTEERLDILVNNAGVGGSSNKLTEDGLPVVMQVNYFSHFLLTMLLLDLLKKTESRVVNVSALGASWKNFDIKKLIVYDEDWKQYILSKQCQIYFTMEFAKRFKDTSIKTYSLHPGVIKTEIFRNMSTWSRNLVIFIIDWFFKTASEGAQTQIYCSVANNLEQLNGAHFHDCRPVETYKTLRDGELGTKVWEESERIVKL